MRITRDSLTALITRNDDVAVHAVGRALVHLLNRQTRDEQRDNTTRNHNMMGFTPADARQGSIHAKYYLKHGQLADWQLAYWLRPNARGTLRLAKYWRQIDEEAQKKAVAKLSA
jgi:hypothetical protein